MKNQEKNIITDLEEELKYLMKGLDTLTYSYTHCQKIGIKESYSYEELDKWEAFTARYARLSDILTQKIFNSMMIVMEGYAGSLIDKAHFAEKNNLLSSAEEFTQLRLLRNFIAHEYTKQNTNEIFIKVFDNCPMLIDLIVSVNGFCRKNIFSA